MDNTLENINRLKCAITKAKEAQQVLRDQRDWIKIERVDGKGDIFFGDLLYEEEIKAITELIDSLLEREIVRYEGAIWKIKAEESSSQTTHPGE